MVKKKTEGNPLGLEYYFPKLHQTKSKFFAVEKRHESYAIGGYQSIEKFGEGIQSLYEEDFKRFLDRIDKLEVEAISEIVNKVIKQVKAKVSTLTHKTETEGKRYYSFLRPVIVKGAQNDNETRDKEYQLKEVEPYAEEFVNQTSSCRV